MKSPISLLLLLATITTALQTDIVEPANVNALNLQNKFDHCKVAKMFTRSYDTAYKQSSGVCPNEYWKVSTYGCCSDDAAGKTLGKKGVACCPCGAACTGYFPTPRNWAGIAGKSGSIRCHLSAQDFHVSMANRLKLGWSLQRKRLLLNNSL
jgi:hypothetical protein